MVNRMRHQLLLGPRVVRSIVFIDEAGRLEAWQKPLSGVQLAVDRNAQQFSGGLGEWREPDPFSLRGSRCIARGERSGRRLRKDAICHESADATLPGGYR